MSPSWEGKLILAVRDGKLARVKRLLKAGMSLDTYSPCGETPLGLAARKGDIKMMRFLLKWRVNPDEDDDEGNTPLYKALIAKRYKAIDLLLVQGTPEARKKRAVNAFLLAAHYHDIKLLRRLLHASTVEVNITDEYGRTALISAAENHSHSETAERAARRKKTLQFLLERGADVHKRAGLNRITSCPDSVLFVPDQISALYEARGAKDRVAFRLLQSAGAIGDLTDFAAIGDIDGVRELLEQGVDPNYRDVDGDTALTLAARNGYPEIARFLLERGADASLRDKRDDDTPLSEALDAPHPEVVSVILDYTLGQVVALYPQASSTEQIMHRQKAIGALLLGHNQDINALSSRALTFLMQASKYDTPERVRLLLATGADVNVTNQQGYTALLFAAESGEPETISLLLAAGANVNAVNHEKCTALIYAAERGKLEIVRLLLAAGVNVNAVNHNSCTPLICAVVAGVPALITNTTPSDKLVELVAEEAFAAAEASALELVRVLIEAGTDLNHESVYNNTALDYAIESGRRKIINLLVDAGAQIAPEP